MPFTLPSASHTHSPPLPPPLPPMDSENVVVLPVSSPSSPVTHESLIRMLVVENENGQVKVEEIKQEDEIKEEDNIATVVTIYTPEQEHDDNVQQQVIPVPLGIGEIPAEYGTKQNRMDLLNQHITFMSKDHQALRFDLVGRATQKFIDGEIDGLFQTFVTPPSLRFLLFYADLPLFSHLKQVLHAELKATNRRTARRRSRRMRKQRTNRRR